MNKNLKSKIEEMANTYTDSCDNESGGFLSHQLEAIRNKAFVQGARAMHDILMPIIEMQKDVLCLLDRKIEYTTFYVDQNLTSSSEVISECLEQTDKMLKGM